MVRRVLAVLMVFATCLGAGSAFAQQPAVETDPQGDDATPARLSYSEGAVSFWRPGGSDWAPAQVNTPLTVGDELYTGHDGNLEVQVGGRAFVRAWGDTQVGLTNQDPNFMQLRVTSGHLAVDLRSLDGGDVVEIDTPGAAFTMDQPGYYRVDVTPERTSFVTRREGRATLTTASGPAGVVQPGEAVLLDGGETPRVQRAAAPEPDVWDRWNDTRTAALVTTTSARYVPPQVYGANDLDRYGAWRTDATYGSVWVPARVEPGWVPYSTGRWIWDPHFGWTWLDTAPWGWAPYHYGRWVTLGGVWAWAPGPVVVRPVYSPALVAFFGAPGVTVAVGGPSVSWVALGWGEPLMPWWGRPGFVGRPHWAGWGGPRVREVTVYRNVTVVNAVVAVRSDRFGRGPVHEARIARPDISHLQPVRGRLDIKPEPVSFTPGTGRAVRPPETPVGRTVVSTRPPAHRIEPPRGAEPPRGKAESPRGKDETPRGKGDAARGKDPRPEAARQPQPSGPGAARPEGPKPEGRRETKPDARPARPDKSPVEPPSAKVAPPVHPVPAHPTPPPAPAAPVTPRAPVAPGAGRAPVAPGAGERQRPPEPPRVEAPRPDVRRPEPPRGEPQRPEPQRPAPPRPAPSQGEPPRGDSPRSESPRPDNRRAEPARVEPPRRAAAHGADAARPPAAARPAPARPAAAGVVAPEKRSQPAPGRPGAPAANERGRQER
jgi:hypothetical protein